MRESDSHLVTLYNRLSTAVKKLKEAVELSSEHEAGLCVQKVFGDDFTAPKRRLRHQRMLALRSITLEREPDRHDDPCQSENHENCHDFAQNIVEQSILEVTREVILSFPEAQDVEVFNNRSVSFGIEDNIYLMCLPADELTGMPFVVTNRKSTMNPHILPVTLISTGPKIGALCLFESGSIVGLYLDYKDKVKLCISQLLRLISLSKKEKVAEYQKEFLYYWNQAAYRAKKLGENRKYLSEYNLFLADDSCGTWLQIDKYQSGEVRFYSDSIIFNDPEKIINPQLNDKALYLPLINITDLVPPTDERPWDPSAHIVDIVCGLESQKIDSEMYTQLSELSFSRKNVFIIFRLNKFLFGCVVEFRHSGTAKFTVKIEESN